MASFSLDRHLQEATEDEIRALTDVADEGDAGEGECGDLSPVFKSLGP